MLSSSFTLCCVGLVFSSPAVGMNGHQREVHEDYIFGAQLEAHLADGFEEWKRFDVANGAADFDQDDVHAFGHFAEGGFDFVGDVRDDLHGFAEIIAAAFFGDDGFVEAAGGPVVVAR